MPNKRKFSWWIVPVALLAVLAGMLVWFKAHPVMVQAQSSSLDLSKLTTTKVQLGTVSTAIGATGTVSTSQSVKLAWQISGQVAQVLVKKGDQVQANQLLAQIDPALSPNLVTAQANLLAAEQNLANLQNVAVAQAQAQVSLANAQVAVAKAQANLEALNVPPTQLQINQADAVVLNDQAIVTKLQDAYNKALGLTPVSRKGKLVLTQQQIDMQQVNALAALQNEIQKLNQDQASLTGMQNFTPAPNQVAAATNNLAIAKAQLSSAQATWDSLKNGPDPNQVAAAQAQIASIQEIINQQSIRAPFAGTVTDLAVKPNDLVKPGTYVLEIDNMSALSVALQVSEVDINNVKLGQPVNLTFDGAPTKNVTGEVTDIGSVGAVANGVSNFTVTVLLTNPDSQVKPGMTATANIVTDAVSNVMVVPIRAVVKVGTNTVVYILNNGAVQPVTVTVGLVSDTQMQVTSDSLKPGDRVVTNPTVLSAASSQPQTLSVFNGVFKSLGLVTVSKSSSSSIVAPLTGGSKGPSVTGGSTNP